MSITRSTAQAIFIMLAPGLLTGCLISHVSPDYSAKTPIRAKPLSIQYEVAAHGAIPAEGIKESVRSALDAAGHRIATEHADTKLHVTVGAYRHFDPIFISTIVISGLGLLLLPAKMADNDLLITFQAIEQDGRAYVRSYPLMHYYVGLGWSILFKEHLDKKDLASIVRSVTLQFLDDYDREREGATKLQRKIRLKDGRIFHFVRLIEDQGKATLVTPDGRRIAITMDNISISEPLLENVQLLGPAVPEFP